MKDQIIGYITAMINGHERTIDKLMMLSVSDIEVRKYKNFQSELNDLLDFVEDIREEKEGTITVNLYKNDGEVVALKKRIKELEESCENMCQIERNLRWKINKLEGRKNGQTDISKETNS